MISYEELAAAVERDKAFRSGGSQASAASVAAEDHTHADDNTLSGSPGDQTHTEFEIGDVLSDEEAP